MPVPTMSKAGAVVDRGADDRQAKRDVHGLAERRQLDRDQPLVVVAGDHHVEAAAQRPTKIVSAGNGPVTSMPRAAHASTAGRSTLSSSCPSSPCSPA